MGHLQHQLLDGLRFSSVGFHEDCPAATTSELADETGGGGPVGVGDDDAQPALGKPLSDPPVITAPSTPIDNVLSAAYDTARPSAVCESARSAIGKGGAGARRRGIAYDWFRESECRS